jgi:hypothetical protein
MREVVDGNGFFFLAAPGSGGGGGGESEEETARKDTEQESKTAADPIRVVPREKYIPSPAPFFRCVSLSFPLFLALAHKPVFCTNSVRNLYAITIPLLLLPLLCKRAIAGATKEQQAAAAAATTPAADSHHQNLEQRRT